MINPLKPFFYCTLMALVTSASAHEFWIEPEQFELRSGRELRAQIRIGEAFSGDTHAFFPHRFERFELINNDRTFSVQSRLGDRPAIQQRVTGDTLLTILYESRYDQLTYDDFEQFQAFLELEGIGWVLDQHRTRGLPESGFSEVYRRFSKTLVAINSGQGQDQHQGMEFEWVLLTNPYQPDRDSPLTAELSWQGEPMANALARVFIRTENSVDIQRLTTDEQGRVELPRVPGADYLVNAVHMVAPETDVAEQTGAVWESLWASLVFRLAP
ncbi:MAG: DUF4198 domain-containing protein [Saccharospirillum sp.]